MRIDLTDQVALVTGSAHRVGKAIALELARCGVHILVHYNSSPEAATETVREIKSLGVDAFSVQADISVPGGVEAVFAALSEHFDRLHILVNSGSDRITIVFPSPIFSLEFDYEIFPNGDVPDGSKVDPSKFPDFTLIADGKVIFQEFGVIPGTNGTFAHSPFSGPNRNELAPQLLATSGLITFANGVTRLEFVDWPEARDPATSPVLVLAVGDDPLVQLITATAGHTRVAGRPVQVRAVRAGAAIEGAHMVFIAGSERHQLPALLRQLDGYPVLTVAATDGFAESGVVLNLVVRDRKVRVEANTAAASRARLRVSAHLLRVARLVG